MEFQGRIQRLLEAGSSSNLPQNQKRRGTHQTLGRTAASSRETN